MCVCVCVYSSPVTQTRIWVNAMRCDAMLNTILADDYHDDDNDDTETGAYYTI